MRQRRGPVTPATLTLVVGLLVLAAVAAHTGGGQDRSHRSTTDVAVPAADGISHATFTSVAPPRANLLDAGSIGYLAATLLAAFAVASWTAGGVSSRSLIARAGLARRLRAPPLAGS